MSLLIKALDKAQEEAQAAKVKRAKAEQIEAEITLQSNTVIDANARDVADNSAKPKSLSLNPDNVNPSNANKSAANQSTVNSGTVNPSTAALKTLVNAASEKVAAANALELELSPNPIKTGQDFNSYSDKSTEIKAAKPISVEPLKSQNFISTSKASASSMGSSKADAANVFAAKRIEANHQASKLALIAGAGLLALLAMGAYLYQFIDNTPDIVIAKRPAMLPAAEPQTRSASITEPTSEVVADNTAPPANQALSESAAESQPTIAPQNLAVLVEKPVSKTIKKEAATDTLRLTESEDTFDEVDVEKSQTKKLGKLKQTDSSPVEIASKSASIQVSKTTVQAGVNPVLMTAYDAYNAGKDAEAIKLYKQVLQRDVRNVDALLGLGAIAQRQGRVLDANGWYGKVLEVDPKNSFALTAILESQPQNNVINSESRIKSMLAKQPDDANLHATLGNFYADANQWSLAQQAYFDAYRLNASADNAFNLAVSLDQLGKPKLALPYYQRALLLVQSTNANFDKAALEARISAIQ